MTPGTLQHWLPRIAGYLIESLAAEQAALAAGDLSAAAEHAEDADGFAALAWRAIQRAASAPPQRIAKPPVRTTLRRKDIHLHRTRLADHPAMPPRNARPI